MMSRLPAFALVVMIAGACASALVAVRIAHEVREEMADESELRARRFTTAVEQQLNRVTNVSRILSGFVAAGDAPPSREAFVRFSEQLMTTGGFLHATAWAPRLPREPGGAADRYPLRFRAPEPDDPSIFGKDIAAFPDRAPALRRAVASGAPAASGAVRFFNDGATGAVVYHAVYRRGADLTTETSRRAAVEGVVAVTMRIDIFLRRIDSVFAGRDFGVRLFAGEETLARLPAPAGLDGAGTTPLRIPFSVAGAEWGLEMALPPAPAGWPAEAWEALFAGLLATLLVAAGLWTAGRRARASRRRIAELAGAARRLQGILEAAPFPAMVRADDGAVLDVNKAWLDLSGHAREDFGDVSGWNALAFGGEAGNPFTDVARLHDLDRSVDEGEREVRTAGGGARLWALRSSPAGVGPDGRRLALSMAADLTDRRESEARLQLLMREVDHRAKNALAVVQAIVHLSKAGARDPATFADTVDKRIQAVARAHSLLAEGHWSGVPLDRLLRDELAAAAGAADVEVAGPPISIRPEAAQTVSIVLHEMTTNALKYGALSDPRGRLSVRWTPDPDGRWLALDWSETGGPPLDGPPRREGFGVRLLRQSVEGQLRGRLAFHWRREGLAADVRLPAETWAANGVEPGRAAAVPPPAAAAPRRPVAAEAPATRVLLVEDESLTAMALERALADAGFEVHGPAARVDDALRLARSVKFDAAVLDVNLFGAAVTPVADALAAMGVPFLFCTGYDVAFAGRGAHDEAPVLGKPVQADTLVRALRGLLAGGPAVAAAS